MNRLPPSSVLLLRLVRAPATLKEVTDAFRCSPRARVSRERLTEKRLGDLSVMGFVSIERRLNGRYALTAAGKKAIEEDSARTSRRRRIPEPLK